MNKGKTKSGFKFSISASMQNDYEVVELLSELEENPFLLTKLVNSVLGKEQANELKNHVRDKNGVVPTDKMMLEITEIFENSGEESKNS